MQSEGFVSSSGYVGFTLQVTPTVIIPKPGRLYHQSFLLECQFDRSESSGFPVCFLPRHWCGCVPAPRVRRNPDRCRYRYICRTVGLPARGSCRPKQIRFLLQGRLKRLRFSDGLCLSFCPRHCSCTPKFLSYHLF